VRDQANVVGSRSVCDIDTMTLVVCVCGGEREKKTGPRMARQGYMGWYNTRREVRVLSARHEEREHEQSFGVVSYLNEGRRSEAEKGGKDDYNRASSKLETIDSPTKMGIVFLQARKGGLTAIEGTGAASYAAYTSVFGAIPRGWLG